MSSFMNNYYYGKAGKADFTEDQLPSNRFELFFTTLRLHISGLIGMNLLYLLFALPAVIWTVKNVDILLYIASEQQEPGSAIGYISIYLIGMIPCIGLIGVGLSGIAYILRNWSRDQHAFTLSDFKDSLKSNWKLGLMEGLLTGLSLFVAWYSYLFYGSYAANSSVFFVVPEVLVLTVVFLFNMSAMLAYPMLVTYDLKFRHVVRNSLLITLRRLPMSILVFAPSIAIPLVLLGLVWGTKYGLLAMVLIYMLFGFAFTEFIYISYANSCFDKYLNPLIEGAPVNLGLREKDDEDDEEEEEESQNPPLNPPQE